MLTRREGNGGDGRTEECSVRPQHASSLKQGTLSCSEAATMKTHKFIRHGVKKYIHIVYPALWLQAAFQAVPAVISSTFYLKITSFFCIFPVSW